MGKNSKGKAAKQPAPGERQVIANNKKARHDYTILDTYEAGMVLTGTEVKSLREGKASLVDGFAVFYRTSCGSSRSTSRSTSTARGPTTPPAAAASCCCTAPS